MNDLSACLYEEADNVLLAWHPGHELRKTSHFARSWLLYPSKIGGVASAESTRTPCCVAHNPSGSQPKDIRSSQRELSQIFYYEYLNGPLAIAEEGELVLRTTGHLLAKTSSP